MKVAKGSGLPDHYPVTCPHCAALSGLPVGVTTVVEDPRALKLEFKCGTCHHRWWQQFDSAVAAGSPEESTASN